MIKGFEHVGDTHKCNVCSCEFTEDEGGVLGYFGILPVAFCPTCYSSMVDMVSQDLEIGIEEWINLDHGIKKTLQKLVGL